MLDYLQKDPMGFLLFMLYRAPAVLLALTFHEVAHGYVALRCGDPTAKLMHRLSLNPIKHMDPIGTASMFLLGFGWAKPVPVNPNNFKRGRRDDLLVSLAGVTTNFILFLISTLLTVLVGFALYVPELIKMPGFMSSMLSITNRAFVIEGLIKIDDPLYLQLYPEYAGYITSLLKTPWLLHIQRFLLHFSMINLGLCLFNLIPLPPLDGFHVLNDLVLKGRINLSGNAFRITHLALIVLMFSTDIVSRAVGAAVSFVQGLVLGGYLRIFGL